MVAVERRPMTVVRTLKEIPAFTTEAEEAECWATHALGKTAWAEMEPIPDDELPPPRPRTKPVAIRFDEHTIQRAKALAGKRHKGYQTLLKEFVMERLYEEEKREGLIG